MKYIDNLDLWIEKNLLNSFLIKYKYILIFSILFSNIAMPELKRRFAKIKRHSARMKRRFIATIRRFIFVL